MVWLILWYGPREMLFLGSYQSMQVPRVQFMGQICFITTLWYWSFLAELTFVKVRDRIQKYGPYREAYMFLSVYM